MVRRTQMPPLLAHRSRGFLLSKPQGGWRLAHGMCPYWSSYYKGLMQQAEKDKSLVWAPPPYTHAYWRWKRREDAMLTSRIVSWRAKQSGHSMITTNHDMSNAFPCA
eukprot:5778869-Lingulodinium_polyedra.AAC.1